MKLQPIIKAYLHEAIELEKAGLKVEMKEKSAMVFPEEYQIILDESKEIKTAFKALTPG